jgi:hypothetical protein
VKPRNLLGQRRCPACGHRELLVVRWVEDRAVVDDGAVLALDGSIPEPRLRAWTSWGVLQLVACRACGAAEWYVQGIDLVKDDPPRIMTLDGTCEACRGRTRVVSAAQDKVGRGEVEPLTFRLRKLRIETCVDCVRAVWFVDPGGLAVAPGADGGLACHHRERTAWATVDEKRAAGDLEPLAVEPAHELRACACLTCGALDWKVVDPGAIVVDGRRIVVVKAPPDEGPYR